MDVEVYVIVCLAAVIKKREHAKKVYVAMAGTETRAVTVNVDYFYKLAVMINITSKGQ